MLDLQNRNERHGIFYIRTFGDPILNQNVDEITEFDSRLALTVNSMLRFLGPRAIGIAAPQVGVQRRVFGWQLDGNPPGHIVNPEIVEHSPESFISTEGCLSIPGLTFQMLRWNKITIQGYDVNGKEYVTEGTGLRAALFQHEIDHLDGVLTVNSMYRVG